MRKISRDTGAFSFTVRRAGSVSSRLSQQKPGTHSGLYDEVSFAVLSRFPNTSRKSLTSEATTSRCEGKDRACPVKHVQNTKSMKETVAIL